MTTSSAFVRASRTAPVPSACAASATAPATDAIRAAVSSATASCFTGSPPWDDDPGHGAPVSGLTVGGEDQDSGRRPVCASSRFVRIVATAPRASTRARRSFPDGSQRCGATWRQPNRKEPPMQTDTINPATILVLANETVEADELLDVIERSAGGEANVLVVAPALNSRLRHWASDEDTARDLAKDRLQRSVEHLHGAGVDATGMIGDADPLQALRDALA